MIGDIIHFTGTNGRADSKSICFPAIVFLDLPNDRLDVLVFKPNSPAVTRQNVEQGEVRAQGRWHASNHGKQDT